MCNARGEPSHDLQLLDVAELFLHGAMLCELAQHRAFVRDVIEGPQSAASCLGVDRDAHDAEGAAAAVVELPDPVLDARIGIGRDAIGLAAHELAVPDASAQRIHCPCDHLTGHDAGRNIEPAGCGRIHDRFRPQAVGKDHTLRHVCHDCAQPGHIVGNTAIGTGSGSDEQQLQEPRIIAHMRSNLRHVVPGEQQ